MAFPTVVSVTSTIAPANQTQVIFSNIQCQANDLLIAYVYHSAQSSGNLTDTTGTWTIVTKQNGPFNNSLMMQKVAQSSSESLTMNNAGSFAGSWAVILYVIRGATATMTASKAGNFNATTAGIGAGNLASNVDGVWISAITGMNLTNPPSTYTSITNVGGSPALTGAYKLTTQNQEFSYAWNGSVSNWATYTTVVYAVGPSITSPSAYTVPVNLAATFTLTANNANGGTWSMIGGANQSSFSLSGSNLTLQASPAGKYVVIVRITTTDNQTADQTITVTVTDRNKVRWTSAIL